MHLSLVARPMGVSELRVELLLALLVDLELMLEPGNRVLDRPVLDLFYFGARVHSLTM